MLSYGTILSDISSWASIVSLIATFIIALTTGSIKKKVQKLMNFRNFKVDKKTLENELKSISTLLTSNAHGDDLQNISDLSQILRRLENYKLYMIRSDRAALKRCKSILKKGQINQNKHILINDINTLIGFLAARVELDESIL
jgi:maltooligosyltrehalose synthase